MPAAAPNGGSGAGGVPSYGGGAANQHAPLRQTIAQVPRRTTLQLMSMRPCIACCCTARKSRRATCSASGYIASLGRCALRRQLCVQLHPGPEAQHGTVRKPGSTRSRKRQESQKRWVDRQKASCSPCCLGCMLLAAATSAGASQRRAAGQVQLLPWLQYYCCSCCMHPRLD